MCFEAKTIPLTSPLQIKMIKIIIVSFVVHAYTNEEGKTKMEGTSPVLQLRYFLNIPGFLSVLALMFLSPGLDATVLLAGFVESGWYMYNVCVGDHCTPVDIQPRITSSYDPGWSVFAFIGLACAG